MLHRLVRGIVDWFFRLRIHKWSLVRCRRCYKTKVVIVGTNEYLLLLNDIKENGVVVSAWTWAAVNKQKRGRMTTEHLCRPCREIEIKESCERIQRGEYP